MDIIPQHPTFVQAGIYPNSDLLSQFSDRLPTPLLGLTSIQQQAYRLFDAGMNVFPLPRGSKSGYPWRRLQYTRLNRDDEAFGLTPLFAGLCNVAVLCGATSGNLFVIDCETHETFIYHLNEIQKRFIPVWAVVTARGGHIYLRCQDGEVENIAPGILLDAEIRGRNNYVLAVSSLHPSGKLYEWAMCEDKCPPLVSAAQIDWLRDSNGKQVKLQFTPNRLNHKMRWKPGMVSPFSNLSLSTKEYLASGHQIPEGSRNNRLFSAACDMIGNNYTQSEIENLLVPIAIMSGLPQHEVLLTLESALSRQRTPARPGEVPQKPASEQNPVWLRALLCISHRDWTGPKGGNLRALLLALVERARLGANEKGIFRASLRELADMGRMAVNTVRRLLELLVSAGQVVKAGNDKMSGASLWRFSEAMLQEGMRLEALPDAVVPEHWCVYAESLFYSDASERGSIGKSGMFLYRFMTTRQQPMMPSELAWRSGLTLNQVNYALAKLKQLNLVRRVRAGWVADNCSDDELSEVTRTAGKGEARRRQHRKERELFAGRLLLQARMRTEGKAFMEALITQTRALRRMMQPRRSTQSGDEAASPCSDSATSEN